jgi:hypothetical protein
MILKTFFFILRLVDFHVGSTQVEAGNGYYECLLRKSQKLLSEDDPALKQVFKSYFLFFIFLD